MRTNHIYVNFVTTNPVPAPIPCFFLLVRLMANSIVKISKLLSLVLRHQPDKIGLTLDENGWVDVDELLRCVNQHGTSLTRDLLEQVVAENDKKRFAFSDDRLRIRASQGHSISVDLALPAVQPPELLYHGTATRFVDSIRETGLHSGSRQHLHLSIDVETAISVGKRHGKPVVLTILAGELWRNGQSFYLSENHVWLTESVPVSAIQFPAST